MSKRSEEERLKNRERQRKYYQEHKEYYRAYCKKYYQKNKWYWQYRWIDSIIKGE